MLNLHIGFVIVNMNKFNILIMTTKFNIKKEIKERKRIKMKYLRYFIPWILYSELKILRMEENYKLKITWNWF